MIAATLTSCFFSLQNENRDLKSKCIMSEKQKRKFTQVIVWVQG